MAREYDYVKIPELARRLGVSKDIARQIAHSKLLQVRKGAVLDVCMGDRKYKVLTVNFPDAIDVFTEFYDVWIPNRTKTKERLLAKYRALVRLDEIEREEAKKDWVNLG